MIIWRGLGILVVITVVVTMVLVQLLANAVLGGYAQHSDWLFPLGLLLAAVVIWPLGCRLNNRNTRTLVDPKTGQHVTLQPNHSLFFVKMEYWAIILCIGAVALFGQALLF